MPAEIQISSYSEIILLNLLNNRKAGRESSSGCPDYTVSSHMVFPKLFCTDKNAKDCYWDMIYSEEHIWQYEWSLSVLHKEHRAS